MEKPTGVIQKIIESLQQINALDVYSPIEKDIIMHNLRAAYMIFLNLRVDEESEENRVERLFVEEKGEKEKGEEENGKGMDVRADVGASGSLPNVETENLLPLEETIEEETEIETQEIESIIEEEIVEEEIVKEEIVKEEIAKEEIAEPVEEEIIDIVDIIDIVEEETIIEETVVEESVVEELTTESLPDNQPEEETPPPQKAPDTPEKQPLHDDLLEFIPDAQPQATLLFEETTILKSEKKSLNDLLTEKKEDQSLGTKFQQSYIPDLTKAIAINEKFTFIRELFRNSGMDFSNAVQKLNDCENIDAAFNLMEELKHQYLWDTTSSTYLSLCDLVRRRFL